MEFYDVRGDINNIVLLKKYLDKNNARNDNIEQLLGEAIVQKNSIAISIINSYILENDIKITKNGVFKNIYYAECRKEINRARNAILFSRVSFDDFGCYSANFGEYYEKYNHIIKIHNCENKKYVNLESTKIFLNNYSVNNSNSNNIDVFKILGDN